MGSRVLARDIRLTVLASAIGSALVGSAVAPSAYAQEGLDEITVTGTRIRRDDYNSVTSTQNITAEDMQRLGLVSAADMLAQLPSNVGTFQLDADGSSFGSEYNVGSTLANLRGMNTGLGTRTLVLVDGRRQVQTNNGGGVDLSFVPSILISRMEAVTGGASAVYGSDATAGVVNIILDRNVQGLRLDASYGQNKNGDFRNYSVAIASGINNLLDGRGSLTVSYERQITDPVASCGEVLEWCAKSASAITTAVGSQLYRYNPANGLEQACGGFFQPLCTGIIPPRNRLFPDEDLPHNMFYEGSRLLHEATTNGSLHTTGPRRFNPNQLPTAAVPNPLTGLDEPTAGTFYKFNDDGTDIVPFQESLTDFWREYAWRSPSNRVQGGEGPLHTFGSPTRSGQERDNLFANFRWAINDDITLNTRLTYGVTTGENIQNTPRNLQGNYCVFLPARQTTWTVGGVTQGSFDPNTLAIPGVNARATGKAEYDGNPAYAGHHFYFDVNPSVAVQMPDGSPVPIYNHHLGPMNGFLDPRAPHPISDEMRQVLLDRSLGYATAGGVNAALQVEPNAYGAACANSGGAPAPSANPASLNPAGVSSTSPFGVAINFARQGITIQKNLGDWVDRRVLTDTDSMSLGFSADGPLFSGDKWTWDASVQFGKSDREQIRTDIRRNYRWIMASDAVYDPEANGGQGGVVCKVNASDAVGGEIARQLFRNYILGLSSTDVYWASIGATLPPADGAPPGSPRVPVVIPANYLQQGMDQVDLLREGCQALNPFGQGYATGDAADEARQRAAIEFAFGDQIERSTSDQLTASFSISGEIWKGFGAGPVRMATGIDYRDNSTVTRNDSPGGDAPIVKADFGTQYGDPWNGLSENYELFSEFELPLVRDRLGARYLSANFTGRKNYSKSAQAVIAGEATTFVSGNSGQNQRSTQESQSWRASLNWSVTDWMRLRTTKSLDTRSPSSRELFSSATIQTGGFGLGGVTLRNPWREEAAAEGQNPRNEDEYSRIRGANESLNPEASSTNSIGIVFTPGGWASGLSLSFDYQEITIRGGITYLNDTGTASGETEGIDDEDGLDDLPYAIYRCYQFNDPFWCGKITFNPLGSAEAPNELGLDPYTDCAPAMPCAARSDIVAYEDVPFNAEPYWTRNLDVSASYNLQLDGGGSVSMRLLATHALEQSRCLQVVRSADGMSAICEERQNVVGVTGQGGGTPGRSNFTSQPSWSGNIYASYSKQAFTITGQARYIGKGIQSLEALGVGDPGFEWNMYNTFYQQDLPSWTTFNLTTGYNFARSRFAPERFENLQLTLTIDNLFDKQPDFYSCLTCTGGVNTRFYNGNGRTFRLNLRSQF